MQRRNCRLIFNGGLVTLPTDSQVRAMKIDLCRKSGFQPCTILGSGAAPSRAKPVLSEAEGMALLRVFLMSNSGKEI